MKVVKNRLSAIGVDSLRGTQRNTCQNNVDDCAMKEKLEQFYAAFRDEFLSFASDQLFEDENLMEAIKQYTMELMAASEELKQQQQQSETNSAPDAEASETSQQSLRLPQELSTSQGDVPAGQQ